MILVPRTRGYGVASGFRVSGTVTVVTRRENGAGGTSHPTQPWPSFALDSPEDVVMKIRSTPMGYTQVVSVSPFVPNLPE